MVSDIAYYVYQSQKLPEKLALSVDIPSEGTIGLCLSVGVVTIVSYSTQTDGRILFENTGWRNVYIEHHLQVDQAVVLMIPRRIPRNNMAKALTIDLINYLARVS